MKNLRIVFSLLFVVFIASCSDDDRSTDFLDSAEAPSNIDLVFGMTDDNSGLVMITPSGQGVTSFEVFASDDSEMSVILMPGESTSFTYAEGTYNVKVLAKGVDGEITEYTETLTVSFEAPQNLVVSIEPVPGDVFSITVDATADLEAFFEFYPGVSEDETPIQFMEGETITYTYEMVGDYEVTVIAYSGGVATTEYTETISILNPLLLPITFEDPTLNYNFIDFGGAATSVVANPNVSGVNQSETVAQSIKTAGAEFFAGTVIQLDDPLDLSTLKNIKVDVLSPMAGITVKLKLENLDDPDTSTEIDVINTVANDWETLVFDFSSSDLTQEYQKVIIFFDFGNVGDGSTYYLDNIDLSVPTGVSFELVENFEGEAPIFLDFGNQEATEVVANPDPSGINVTSNVVRITKTSGAEFFAGSFFELQDAAIDFDAFKQLRLKSYSPKVGAIIKVKLENADASITTEVDVLTTVANQWETLTYDFSAAEDVQYTRIVVFYDFNVVGDGSVYYYDEVEVGEGEFVSLLPAVSIENFEGEAPIFLEFGNIEPIIIVSNPNPTGLNTTAMVAQHAKTSGSETFAGSFFEVGTPLDFDNFSKIKVLTHSPKSGITVKLKLENSDASVEFEKDITNTVTDDWEALEFDFSDAPEADYVRIVIFFDFGNAGDGSTYYFDEFELTN